MVTLVILVAIIATLFSASTASAQAPAALRVVEGHLTNGTANGGSVDSQTVVFHEEGAVRHDHMEAKTDAEGRFRFENIVYDSEVAYGVSIVYQNALYGLDLDLSAGSPASVPLTVYDSVTQDTVLTVPSVSMLVSQADKIENLVWALEIYKINNASDTTYVPGAEGPMSLLRFGLPDGADNLQVDTNISGAQLFQVDKGFALSANVPPGEYEVMFAYTFPYDGTEASITKTLWYGADNVRVLLPQEVADLNSPELGSQTQIVIGERTYDRVEGDGFKRGETISVQFTSLPVASFSEKLNASIREVRLELVAPLALGIFLAGLIGLVVWRNRRGKAGAPVGATPLVRPGEVEQTLLIETLARLEESFERGDVPEPEYAKRREEITRQLTSIARRQVP